MEAEKVKELFTEYSSYYDDSLVKEVKWVADEKMLSLLIPLIKNKQLRILDLGCGTGRSSFPLISLGHQVTGVDITQAMLEQAKKHSFEQLIYADIEKDIPVEGLFDVILLVGVAEFVNDLYKILRNVKTVLNSGGLFCFAFPKLKAPGSNIPDNIKTYSFDEVESFMKELGFKIIVQEEFVAYERYGEDIIYGGYIFELM